MNKKKKKHQYSRFEKSNTLSQKTGLPPGSLIHVGKVSEQPVSIHEMIYSDNHIEFHEKNNVSECFPLAPAPAVTWIDVTGIHDRDIIDQIGHALHLHPLTMEDIMNAQQRAKMEDYEHYQFLSLKTAMTHKDNDEISYSQLSIIFGESYLITFQESREMDILGPVRARLEQELSKLENMGNDYLLYAIIDNLVDTFFDISEFIEDHIDKFDEMVIDEKPLNLQDMYRLKRSIIQMRKCVVPLRDILSRLLRLEDIDRNPMTEVYFTDIHDHVLRLSENLEVYREIMNSLHETYLSSISNRMNAVMKVLTVISTIFIPLTFIVGVYGMNFPNIPEFRNPHAYYYVWGVMLSLVVFMLFIFRHNKWL